MTAACCLHNSVTESYMYGILNATCKSRVGVRLVVGFCSYSDGCKYSVTGTHVFSSEYTGTAEIMSEHSVTYSTCRTGTFNYAKLEWRSYFIFWW